MSVNNDIFQNMKNYEVVTALDEMVFSGGDDSREYTPDSKLMIKQLAEELDSRGMRCSRAKIRPDRDDKVKDLVDMAYAIVEYDGMRI